MEAEFQNFKNQLFRQFVAENKDVIAAPSFHDLVMGFIHAVRWNEPFVVGLLVFHLLVFVLAVATRKHNNVQGGLLVVICAAVYAAQYINGYLAQHWEGLGITQNYFDDRGAFITLLYSTPLLLVCGFLMLNAFFGAIELLVKLKREELRRSRRATATTPAAAPLAAGGSSSGASSSSDAEGAPSSRTRSRKTPQKGDKGAAAGAGGTERDLPLKSE